MLLWFVSCCSSEYISNIPFPHVLYIYTHHRLHNDSGSGDAQFPIDASVLDDKGCAHAVGAFAADDAGARVLDDKDRAHAVGAFAADDASADDNGKEVDVG